MVAWQLPTISGCDGHYLHLGESLKDRPVGRWVSHLEASTWSRRPGVVVGRDVVGSPAK